MRRGWRWVRDFFERHPLVRDAVVWSVPAVLFGLALRLMLMSYSPYAFWGSDSRSYFGFTNGVLTEFYFSLNEKRRYLYPLFVLPISLLPGGTLRWLPWIQMAIGLGTVVAMGYVVRRVFRAWKWLIVPVTALFAGMPVLIWHEHELIGDLFFFYGLVWAMAGWAAWVSQGDARRARALWWWFFVPLGIMMLSKPAVRFLWPGLVLGLLVVAAWRVMRWRETIALGALIFASFTLGESHQTAWLLYTTAFPLTRLDTPLHAEYKAGIRDWVGRKRARLDYYQQEDDEVHDFLRNPRDRDDHPLWSELAKDSAKQNAIYRDLAIEAVTARPDLFLGIGLRRLAGSCNPDEFSARRLDAAYYGEELHDATLRNRNPESMVRIAFGIPKDEPLPDADALRQRVSPRPDSAAARWLVNYTKAYQAAGTLRTRAHGLSPALANNRLTPLAWALIGGVLLSAFPPFLRTLGAWNAAILGYLFAVYLVGIEQSRYFAAAWPVFLLSLALVPEAAFRLGEWVRARVVIPRRLG